MDESSGYVEVKVWRTGTDLSKVATVTVRSRKSDPVSAEGNAGCLSERTVSNYGFAIHGFNSTRQRDWTTSALVATSTLPLE